MIKLGVDPGISLVPSLLCVIAAVLVVILSCFLVSIPTSSTSIWPNPGRRMLAVWVEGCWQSGLKDAELRFERKETCEEAEREGQGELLL